MGLKKLVDVINGQLWQSGNPASLEQVLENRINTIVSLSLHTQPWLSEWKNRVFEEFKGPEQPRHAISLQIPLWDADDCLDVAGCEAAIEAIMALLIDPERRILVHCDMGAFRSVHVAACVYAKYNHVSGRKAFQVVDYARGFENPRDGLLIRGWDKHIDKF